MQLYDSVQLSANCLIRLFFSDHPKNSGKVIPREVKKKLPIKCYNTETGYNGRSNNWPAL